MCIALIFARGGSKGLPNKNIKNLLGKPLLGRAIEQAKAVRRITRVVVSTDSDEIAKIALDYGAEILFKRPKELALDNSPEWHSWQHALREIEKIEGILPEVMISIPTTAPMRSILDIENCLDEFEKGGADIVFGITPSHSNPYFNMVSIKDDNFVSLVMQSKEGIVRRQDSPVVYDITTVAYVANSKFVLNHHRMFDGHCRGVYIPQDRSLDIDTELDFLMAEFLMAKNEAVA
jgi:N-acylneuraminate cytidylyltransferase